MRVGAAALACVLAQRPASAQLGEVRVAGAGYDYAAPVTSAGGSTSTIHQLRAGVTVPLALIGTRTYFLSAVSYQLMDVETSGVLAGRPPSWDLHRLTLDTLLVQKLGTRWSMVVGAGYGLASDLAAPVTGADLYATGTALGMLQVTPTLLLGAGVSYGPKTSTLGVVPLGALSWQPARDLEVRIIAPSVAYATWRAARPLTLSLMAAIDSQFYNVHPAGGTRTLVQSVVKVGVGPRVHLAKLVHVEVLAGLLFARRFELFADTDHGAGDGTFLPAGPFVGTSMWLGTSGWTNEPR